jgi:hypothetical protein
MSLAVELEDVHRHVERLGALANLISTGDDGTPHVVSVLVSTTEGGLRTAIGGRTRANLLARPRLCLLWPVPAPAPDAAPPGDGACYQLILDGAALTVGELDAGRAPVTLEVTSGILHRVAGTPGGPGGDEADAPSRLALDAPPR